MAVINIEKNKFYDRSSVIQEYKEYGNLSEHDWVRFEAELAKIRSALYQDNRLRPAVVELETAVKRRSMDSVKRVAKQFALDFASATFAGVASKALLALIH